MQGAPDAAIHLKQFIHESVSESQLTHKIVNLLFHYHKSKFKVKGFCREVDFPKLSYKYFVLDELATAPRLLRDVTSCYKPVLVRMDSCQFRPHSSI